jgi:transposase InsO family protein
MAVRVVGRRMRMAGLPINARRTRAHHTHPPASVASVAPIPVVE